MDPENRADPLIKIFPRWIVYAKSCFYSDLNICSSNYFQDIAMHPKHVRTFWYNPERRLRVSFTAGNKVISSIQYCIFNWNVHSECTKRENICDHVVRFCCPLCHLTDPFSVPYGDNLPSRLDEYFHSGNWSKPNCEMHSAKKSFVSEHFRGSSSLSCLVDQQRLSRWWPFFDIPFVEKLREKHNDRTNQQIFSKTHSWMTDSSIKLFWIWLILWNFYGLFFKFYFL